MIKRDVSFKIKFDGQKGIRPREEIKINSGRLVFSQRPLRIGIPWATGEKLVAFNVTKILQVGE